MTSAMTSIFTNSTIRSSYWLKARPSSGSAIYEIGWSSLDISHDSTKSASGLARATFLASAITFGLPGRLTKIIAATDARMERILRRADRPVLRIGGPRAFGARAAMDGYRGSRPRACCGYEMQTVAKGPCSGRQRYLQQ